MNPAYRIPPAVRALLIANGTVFILQFIPFIKDFVNGWGPLVADDVFSRGQIWRLGTYMFLHSTTDIFHILFNMLGLWMFGSELEELWGRNKFLFFYLFCGIGAAFFSVFYYLFPAMRFIEIVGASGAVLGLLTAYAVYFPNREVLLFFVIPVRVWLVVAGYAVISLLLAFQSSSAVAHLMHFGGIAAALAYLKGRPRFDQWLTAQRERLHEENVRARAKEKISREQFYKDKVDPVLAKISEKGMEALTPEERKVLKEAGRNSAERLKGEKIIPFEAFKKRGNPR